MIALFKLKRATCKKHRKFPRKHLNNEFTNRKNLKELSYCRNNWIDDSSGKCNRILIYNTNCVNMWFY